LFRLHPQVRTHPVLLGECLGGALYVGDFARLAREAGFQDPRRLSSNELKVGSARGAQHMRWCGAGGQAPTTGSMQSTAAGLQVSKTELTALLGGAKFFEATYRLFKVPGRIETLCED
jgi:hypothetical protein